MEKRKNSYIDNLKEVRLAEISSSNSDMRWIRNTALKVPVELLEKHCSRTDGNIRIRWENGDCRVDIESIPQAEKAKIISYLSDMGMFTEVVPLSARLPFSYQLIPQFLRSSIAKIIGRNSKAGIKRWAKFPLFPLDLSVDAVSDLFCVGYKKLTPTPVILTHDIDSAEALRNLPQFLAEEEAVGARSTNFIVPFKWKIDHGLLCEIKQRGHEIGIHGFDHSNKMPFLEVSQINARMDRMQDFIARYEAVGYRSPSLLRTRKLFQALSRVFKYDSSIPASGGPFPVPNNGCASARIFRVEGIYEIPISMPRDATLLFLGHNLAEIKDIWFKCADIIRESGGMVTMLTHCERRFLEKGKMLSLYRDFIQRVREDGRFVFRTCREIFEISTSGK